MCGIYTYVIETFQIPIGKERINYAKFFELADVTNRNRGHSLKLYNPRCPTILRQNFSSVWIVNERKKLPQFVTDAPSISAFKNQLDKHGQKWTSSAHRLHSCPPSSLSISTCALFSVSNQCKWKERKATVTHPVDHVRTECQSVAVTNGLLVVCRSPFHCLQTHAIHTPFLTCTESTRLDSKNITFVLF